MAFLDYDEVLKIRVSASAAGKEQLCCEDTDASGDFYCFKVLNIMHAGLRYHKVHFVVINTYITFNYLLLLIK